MRNPGSKELGVRLNSNSKPVELPSLIIDMLLPACPTPTSIQLGRLAYSIRSTNDPPYPVNQDPKDQDLLIQNPMYAGYTCN